ncbi:MAG: hypothetical protein ACKV1O_27400 [Saprospiraceae bacterium]
MSLSFSELVDTTVNLQTTEFDNFLRAVHTKRAQTHKLALGHEEAELLKKIYRKLPESVLRRLAALSEKSSSGSLSSEEHEELIGLVEIVENHDAERVEDLASLALLRGVTLRELIAQLGLSKPQSNQ